MVVNQMEGQQYHGAFVIQGCDKTPMAIVAALAHLDRVRRLRGEAPVYATFAPAHVLKGGTIPPTWRSEIAAHAPAGPRQAGWPTWPRISQTTSLYPAMRVERGLPGAVRARRAGRAADGAREHKRLEKAAGGQHLRRGGRHLRLPRHRQLVARRGGRLRAGPPRRGTADLPPTQAQVNAAVDALFGIVNDPAYSVGEIVARNIANVVRVHSASAARPT